MYGIVWVVLYLDWTAWHKLPGILLLIGFLPAPILAIKWLRDTRPSKLQANDTISHAKRAKETLRYRWHATLAAIPIWQFLVFITAFIGWLSLSKSITWLGGAGIFFVGLAWLIWYVDGSSDQLQRDRLQQESGHQRSKGRSAPLEAMSGELKTADKRVWNPLDLEAWYYGIGSNGGRGNRKLNQSLFTFASYGLCFLVLANLLVGLTGCKEIYESPAGGGEVTQLPQQVNVKKVIRKKFVINPFSAILFNPPPIDEVQLELMEVTKHAYTVGQGKGQGAGFSGGTKRGKVRFIRLEYNGGDWDQDSGIGADLNMLMEYGIRTRHNVADKTESRKVAQLKNFPKGKSPPLVYMTGQKNIGLSSSETKILREYLTTKHGMLFADNGGSRHFHGQFVSMMQKVLPTVRPIEIPLDHPVHQVPYPMPKLPYVAPHGGKVALGWVVDNRLAVYYHPGDIGDAWSDGHAGVPRQIWELCYQLGTNIIFYAHAEYNQWAAGQEADAKNK